MARSDQSLKFSLTDDGASVRAILVVDGSRILEFENEEASRVTVRHPKANEKELLEMAEWAARHDQSLKGSPVAALDAYVASREKDVAKRMLEIRKALRQIVGSMRNASLAKGVKKRVRK